MNSKCETVSRSIALACLIHLCGPQLTINTLIFCRYCDCVRHKMSGWQFPNWNYGYTQMPAYNYYQGRPGMGPPGAYPVPAQTPPVPAPPLPPTPAPTKTSTPAVAPAPAPTASGVIKKEAVIKKEPTAAASSSQPAVPEEGEIVEKSIIGILKGRNPVMFCNDQSKMRGLHMEWEQVYIFKFIFIHNKKLQSHKKDKPVSCCCTNQLLKSLKKIYFLQFLKFKENLLLQFLKFKENLLNFSFL